MWRAVLRSFPGFVGAGGSRFFRAVRSFTLWAVQKGVCVFRSVFGACVHAGGRFYVRFPVFNARAVSVEIKKTNAFFSRWLKMVVTAKERSREAI